MSLSRTRSSWLPTVSWFAVLIMVCLQNRSQAIPHLYFDELGFTPWRSSWPAAVQESLATSKPIYVQYARADCAASALFCKQTLSDPQVQKMLRRYYVCIAVNYHNSNPELDNIRKIKGYSEDKTPLHALLTPQREVMAWLVSAVPADQFARELQKNAGDKRFVMSKPQEKEVEKIVKQLEVSLQNKDVKKILQQWQQFLRAPGYSDKKNKGFEMMEAAEEPARLKLYEAARMIRDQKHPQAQVALEEAQRLADSLPLADEIRQTTSALAMLERANEAERQATTAKQKQQALSQYQQIVLKYPDNTIASVAYQKIRTMPQGK